jgi:hypothetical protein
VVRGLKVTFSEDVVHLSPVDPASATNPANYRLVSPAAAAAFGTTSCLSGPNGDTVIAVEPTGYDAGTYTVTLEINGAALLGDGLYRLLVCGTIEDPAGNPLDGGLGAGEDFERSFRVDRFNLLADGHFDRYDPTACGLAAWSSTNPGGVEIDSPDLGASPLSGSAHNTAALAGFDLTQCVAVPGDSPLTLRASIRLDAGATVVASLQSACTFFASPSCAAGNLGPPQQFPEAVAATSGSFLSFDYEGAVLPPAGALSARCTFTVNGGGDPFDAYLDAVFLGKGPEIFSDGFETGDTSRWSVTVP